MTAESGAQRSRLLRAAPGVLIALGVVVGTVAAVALFPSEGSGWLIALVCFNAIAGALRAWSRRSARVRDDT